MTSPLAAARARLAVALIGGEDTSVHRAAITRLEKNARAAEASRTADALAAKEQRDVAAQARADVIVADVQARVAAVLDQHPVPALMDGLCS